MESVLMSAVKRVFTHSAILSPWRNPFEPGDRFYRRISAISRSVFEFNGTQWGELSELIVLNSSSEIEWKSRWPQGDSGGYFFANNNGSNGQSDRFVISSDKKIFGAGFNGTQVVETAFSDQSIHTFRLVSVSGGDVAFYVDNTIVASAPALFPVNINSIGDQYGSATSVTNYAGIFYDLKVWANGDRNTGDLILDIPINERDTDYQRDLTSIITDVNDPGWRGVILQNALPEDWIQIEKEQAWDYWREVDNESNIYEIA
jgi:hypothetical protein